MDTPTHRCRKRTQRDYNLGFKLAVVEQVENGELTYKQAQEAYVSKAVALCWCGCESMVNWTGHIRQSCLCPHPKKRLPIRSNVWKKELEDERLRNLILEEMVDYMDQETGGKLRKKPLAKEQGSSRHKAK